MTTIKSQKKTYRADYVDAQGNPCALIATVRHDDECRNGHNSFAITGDLYEIHPQRGEPTIKHRDGRTLWLNACGCLHDEIAARIPELAPFIKWHLCSTDGPMHYVGNTLYLAGDRDCWGLRRGETRQIRNGRTGALAWKLATVDADGVEVSPEQYLDSDTCPVDSWTTKHVPWNKIGEGKARELDAARRAAIWPEATDDELSAPREVLKAALEARLPQLLKEFRAAVESLGLTY